ncbi:hypothetical protein VFPPC_17884 [Pochonia chlamydosporia 170]|uniref:Uncharacterized protein n=1 Tax=Pochonia chlamydosporia 170 TaxID=1380566 RepID=A0A219AQ62_METCM|nr:hypothetical protein VFPPC_17884 [Pochonia chlamydosporia 170]OWT42923.1 hypothetical protein VFPPC_17884 [Pochonia chlamydosporia 170]
MKVRFPFFAILALAAVAIAAPVPEPDTAVDVGRNFKCDNDYLTRFCGASNIGGRCVNGRFDSGSDMCSNCKCIWYICALSIPAVMMGY